MFRKSLPIGTIVIVILALLVTMSVAYGAWTKTLNVNGTVNTGNLNANFLYTFTDDDGAVFMNGYDTYDLPCTAPSCIFGAGAADPKAAGPDPERYDKAVGACAAWIDNATGKLYFQLDNVYPSYHCTVWVAINNPGSTPWKIAGERYSFNTNALEVTWAPDSPSCGDQVDPNDVVMGGITIHVKDGAAPSSTYTGWYQFDVIQWNQWDAGLCTSTAY